MLTDAYDVIIYCGAISLGHYIDVVDGLNITENGLYPS